MVTPRYLHAQAQLASGLYIIGGMGGELSGDLPLRSLADVERWTAKRGFERRAPLPRPLAEPAVVALSPTELLLSGGYDDEGALRICLLYDAEQDRWRPAGELNEPRAAHDMIRLADGRVLALGGLDEGFEQPVASAELWEPSEDRWVRIDGPRQPRAGATSSLLPDGRVLVVGGRDQGMALTTAELWTP